MSKKKYSNLGIILMGTIFFWLFVLATYEIYWEVDPNIVRSKIIEVNPDTGEEEIIWAGEEIHEELLRTFMKDPKIEYLTSVASFGPLRIGEKAPKGIVLKPNKIPADAQFYVFYNRMGFGMCNNEDCAPLEGKIVRCMGGWLAGDDQPESSSAVGLDNDLVKQGKASIVVVSDKDEKIIGIFPYHTEADIIPIFAQFPEYEESLAQCNAEITESLLNQKSV